MIIVLCSLLSLLGLSCCH